MVDPIAPETRDVKPKTATQALSKDSNLIDIWDRRMQNPDGISAPPIHLRTPGQHLRWINTRQTGRYQRATYQQGWVPVSKDELADEREIMGAQFTTEGYVTRGERQGEMLMKMPEAIFKRIQQRKGELRDKNNQQIRERMSGAASKHFSEKYDSSTGDQAAEVISQFKGNISFGKERRTYGED